MFLQSLRTSRPFLTIAPAVLALSLFACGSSEDDASDSTAFASMVTRWPTPVISVCWESSANLYATEKAWVQNKVESQYETKTRIRFQGWRDCTSVSRGIRIDVADSVGSNPHTQGLGRRIDGVKGGMELNFAFNNWNPACRSSRRKCVESIAVHEFGHAVGLAHEQNRSDTPDTCDQSRQGSVGDRVIGAWDVNSVMNYCNPVYNNGGALSVGDVAGIAAMYGEKEE